LDSILTADVKETTVSAQTMSTNIFHGLTLYPIGFYSRLCGRNSVRLGEFLELNLSIPETSKVKIMMLAHPLGRG
jgi:hypothetical protein